MTDTKNPPAPTRLAQTTGELSSLFSQAEAVFHANINEGQAWDRLAVKVGTSRDGAASFGRLSRWAWTAAAAAGIVVGWFGWTVTQRTPNVASTVPSSVETPPKLENAERVVKLTSGRNELPDGTTAELTDGAQGTYVKTAHESSLSFDNGRVEIAVAHQPEGQLFAVKTKNHAFIVLGTRFTVNVSGERLELAVREGRVAVKKHANTLAIVEGGGRWSNEPSDAGAAEPPLASSTPVKPKASENAAEAPTPTPVLSDPAKCRELSRGGKPKLAEKCYLDIASGSGLSAEMALYEVARLRRDVLSNPSTALSALTEYETRFATGTLAPEAKMAKVDLLARLGRVDEALSASTELLANPIGQARNVELRLLRGNILRDKHDCAAAEREYHLIESYPGPRGDQAQFARATCLEQLGRNAEAILTYQRYLERPNATQTARARQRLSELSP